MTPAVVSATMSSTSMAAMNMFGNGQQVAAQKKGFRQMNSGGSGEGLSRAGSTQSLPVASAVGSVSRGNTKGNVRGASKGRPIGMPVTSTPSIGMRPVAAGKVVKTPSPSQASSRSGERLGIHRGSPMSASIFDPALMASAMNQVTAGMNRGAMNVRAAPPNPQLDFQQVVAQVAGQNAMIPGAGLGNSNVTRNVMPQTASKGHLLNDKIATQLARTANIRNIPPQVRIKPNATAQNAQARPPVTQRTQARQEGVHGPLGKDDRNMLQKTSDLDAQLRRGEGLTPEMVAAKREKLAHVMVYGKHSDRRGIGINPMAQHSQGFYSAAMEAPSGQVGTNNALKTPQQQASIAFLRMAHQNQLSAAANANPGVTAPNIMQNVHDMRSLQNMGVMPPGMTASPAHNVNMLSFLQAAGLGPGPTNTGAINNPAMAGVPANTISTTPPSTGFMNGEAFLQQLLSAADPSAMNSNAAAAALHGQHIGAPAGPLNQAHQASRNGAMPPLPPNPRAALPSSQNAAIDEIDRALGLAFEESDLMD